MDTPAASVVVLAAVVAELAGPTVTPKGASCSWACPESGLDCVSSPDPFGKVPDILPRCVQVVPLGWIRGLA